MMPNSPSETTIAAMLPLRNDGMRNSPKAMIVDLPCRRRWLPHAMKATIPTRAMAKATGMGERSHGQVQSPIVNGFSTVHQP